MEDALSQLDLLTKEESLMVMVRNLEIAHHVDGVVRVVDVNVNATKVLTEAIDENVKAAKVLTEDIDDNVKATKVLIEDNAKGIEGVARNGTRRFLSIFILLPTLFLSS